MPKNKYARTYVISLGGSVMMPGEINVAFLKQFKRFILSFLQQHQSTRFVIVAGGGKIARQYQNAAQEISRVSYEDADWIGIHATRLNAHLLRTIFRKQAHPVVFDNPYKDSKINTNYPIIIASGWRPGWSTDYIAVCLTERFNAKEFINAGKPSHVYTKNIDRFPDAKKLAQISWKEYRKLIQDQWIPGFSSPVDPVAAKKAQRLKLRAIIVSGKNFPNLKRYLLGKPFEGTVIHP